MRKLSLIPLILYIILLGIIPAIFLRYHLRNGDSHDIGLQDFLFFNQQTHFRKTTNTNTSLLNPSPNILHTLFEYPNLAWKIMDKLEANLIELYTNKHHINFKVDLNFYKDKDYCHKSRGYFTNNANELFQSMNVFTDIGKQTILREMVIPKIAKDMYPEYALPRSRKSSIPRFDLMPDIHAYNVHFLWPKSYKYGLEYGCSHQIMNQLPGLNTSLSKTSVPSLYERYIETFQDKPSHCKPNFIPETFKLHNTTQCIRFFTYLNSPKYLEDHIKSPILFLQKQGAHKGRGINLINYEALMLLRQEYGECNEANTLKPTLIQRYVNSPLLLMGHKFDFRVYLLIASTQPFIAYYHDGFLKLSLHEYDVNSNEKGVHLANTDLSKKLFELARENGTWNGMTETELKNFQMWNFTRFANYLYSIGKIKSKNWLDEYLRPQLQRIMIHIVLMMKDKLAVRNNMYHLIGLDFIMDNDLNLWFIEGNVKPSLQGTNEERTLFIMRLLLDHYEIMFNLLRSRMLRVISYINELSRDFKQRLAHGNNNKDIDRELDAYLSQDIIQAKYKVLNSNALNEKAFKASKTNEWKKILDENYNGVDMYTGLIDQSCI